MPSPPSSGGKTTCGDIGRSGSPWLKRILIEIVHDLKQAPGPVGEQYQPLLRAKGKAKATVAAALKVSCYLYWCQQEGWSHEQWLRQHDKLEVRQVQALGSAWATSFGRCSWTVAPAEAREDGLVLRLNPRELLARWVQTRGG